MLMNQVAELYTWIAAYSYFRQAAKEGIANAAHLPLMLKFEICFWVTYTYIPALASVVLGKIV